MNKSYRKSAADLWNTYDTAKIVLAGIMLGLALVLLDYYDIPLQTLYSLPVEIRWILLFALSAVIAIWLFTNHYFDLLKIWATNPVDMAAVITIIAAVIYIPIRRFVLGHTMYITIASWISVVMVAFLFFRFLQRGKKYTKTDNKSSNLVDLKDLYDNNVSRVTGMPILIRGNDVDYDLFDRSEIVNRLYRSIVHCQPDTSYVISLEGEWGSGKTTIINNVKKLMAVNTENHSDIVVIDDFDPWLFGSQEALLLAMYDTLIQHVGLRYSPAKSNRIVKGIAQIVSENYTAGGLVYNLLHNENKCSDEVQVLKKRINAYLQTTNKRIVFFIDNLDRAKDENIIFLFKLISLVFDLPGVVYILSFERERINTILKETHEFDPRFTEKIIQQEVIVPTIGEEKSQNVYSLCIYNLLEAYELSGKEIMDLAPVLKHIIVRIRNIRMFKRVLNSVFSAVFNYGNSLNKSDLLAIEAIRFFDPELYRKIYQYRKFFISHDKSPYDSFLMGIRGKELNTQGAAFFKDLLEQHEDSKDLLKSMFPYVDNYIQNGILERESHFPDPQAPEIARQSRICSRKYFDLYFSYSTNNFLEIRNNVQLFVQNANEVSSITGGVAILKRALSMIPTEDHKEWVEQLQCHIPDILPEKNCYLAGAMYETLDEISDNKEFLGLSPRSRAEYIISELLTGCTDNEFTKFIKSIQTDYKGLLVIWDIIDWLNSSSSKNQELAKRRAELLTQQFNAMCEKILADKINIYSDEYYHKRNAWAFYYYFKGKEDIPRFTAYIMDVLSPVVVYRILWDICSLSIGDNYKYHIPAEHLQIFFNNETLVNDLIQNTPPCTDDEKFVRRVYDAHVNGDADIWGDNSVVTSKPKNLKL